MSDSATSWTAARHTSLSITNSQNLLKLMSIESVILFNHLILCHPLLLLCLQSFPASGSFPVSQFFASGGQTIGPSASASVLPMNIQGWFPLGLTGLISSLSRGISSIISSTTVRKHQFFSAQLSLGSKITADGGCSHEIIKHLVLGRKAMTNLDRIIKSRDLTLPTKFHLVKV